jgi:hypothetical protein
MSLKEWAESGELLADKTYEKLLALSQPYEFYDVASETIIASNEATEITEYQIKMICDEPDDPRNIINYEANAHCGEQLMIPASPTALEFLCVVRVWSEQEAGVRLFEAINKEVLTERWSDAEVIDALIVLEYCSDWMYPERQRKEAYASFDKRLSRFEAGWFDNEINDRISAGHIAWDYDKQAYVWTPAAADIQPEIMWGQEYEPCDPYDMLDFHDEKYFWDKVIKIDGLQEYMTISELRKTVSKVVGRNQSSLAERCDEAAGAIVGINENAQHVPSAELAGR